MSRSLEERVQDLEDCDAIAKLQARYNNLNDGGWKEKGPTHQFPEAVADLFIDNGIWEGPEGTGRAQGRQEIIALFQAFGAVRFIIHCITNPVVEVHGDTAYGEWHAIIPATMPDGTAVWMLGLYKNDFVRSAEGWKYKKLLFEASAVTPYELGWGKLQFAGDQRVVEK